MTQSNAASTSGVHQVKVVILEDGQEVQTLAIGYFAGQVYTVKLDTPEGTDLSYEGTVPARGF